MASSLILSMYSSMYYVIGRLAPFQLRRSMVRQLYYIETVSLLLIHPPSPPPFPAAARRCVTLSLVPLGGGGRRRRRRRRRRMLGGFISYPTSNTVNMF